MKRKIIIVLLMIFLFSNVTIGRTQAAENHSYKAAVLIEANTGKILYEYNKDKVLPQASITKLMTYYVFKDLIKENQISMDTKVKVDISNFNLPSDGSSVPIKNGDILSIDQLIHTMLIASANNSACEIGNIYNQYNGNIIDEMNKKAKSINMKNTFYINTSGLTEDKGEKRYNHTTAYDTAILAANILKDYPETLKITSMRYYEFKGEKVANTNKLLFSNNSIDGMKTGHTDEAGYCMVATKDITNTNGNGNPFRLISVVLGCPSEWERVKESSELLNYGEENFLNKKIVNGNKVFKYKNRFYKDGEIEATTKNDIYLILKKDDSFTTNYKFYENLKSNIKKDDMVGTLTVKNVNDEEVKEFPLYADRNYKTVSFFKKIILYIEKLFNIY